MMRRNIEALNYSNAIFFADKIVNLIRSRELSTGYGSSQAAAPAGSH